MTIWGFFGIIEEKFRLNRMKVVYTMKPVTPDDIKNQFKSARKQVARQLWKEFKILVFGSIATIIGVIAFIVFLATR